jgi:hypothetical protein
MLRAVVDVGRLLVMERQVYWAWGCGSRSGGLVGHKPVGIWGCIHHYFALGSVVCNGGGIECIAVFYAHTMHILNKRHEYRPVHNTIKLLKQNQQD